MIIETHCHLDYLKALPLQEILSRAQEAGVQKFITIGVDPDNLDGVMKLAEDHAPIYFTQGIHPHDAKNFTSVENDKLISRASHPKMVAIGEIGLDYHYNNSPPEIQRKVFEQQLQIAVDHDLPIVVHTREADEDTRDILKNFTPSLKRKGVIHSFTSGKALAEWCLQEGFYLGFNGIITFKNARNVQEVVEITPLEQILLETDSPFLTPVPHRGKENAPYYLPFIAEKI
ncbi:MAG: TatD family hydrolase, partial [Bacteriovoracaceae bacterium]